MVNLKDILSSTSIENLKASQAVEGSVIRMHLGANEGVKGKNPGDDGRNKYFVVLGHDSEGNAIGFDSHGDRRLTIHRRSYHISIGNKRNSKRWKKSYLPALFRLYDGIGCLLCSDVCNYSYQRAIFPIVPPRSSVAVGTPRARKTRLIVGILML